MIQRDLIKDEIERLGRVLGQLVTMLLGTEGGDLDPRQRIQLAQEKLTAEVGIRPEELLELSRAELIARLDELSLEPLHLDQLGDFLAAWAAEESQADTQAQLYARALLLYDLAGERSGSYCMLRAEKEASARAAVLRVKKG